jgi:hypothetical protein
MNGQKTLALPLFLPVLGRSSVFKNRDSCALSQPAHSGRKVHVLVVHHKSKHPSTSPTTEAVERLTSGIDVKRRRLLLMEWANGTEARSRPLEREIRTDQVNDVAGYRYALNGFFGDESHEFKIPCDSPMRE